MDLDGEQAALADLMTRSQGWQREEEPPDAQHQARAGRELNILRRGGRPHHGSNESLSSLTIVPRSMQHYPEGK